MKTRVLFLALVLIFSINLVLADPEIQVYRFQNNGWVRDEAKWQKGRISFLIHGYPIIDDGNNREGLKNLAIHFAEERKFNDQTIPAYDAIYAAEYPKGYHILETAKVVADIVNNRCGNLPNDVKIDVFAHSMGGLIARTAIGCSEEVLGTKNIGNRVAHLVMMGTPQYGFYEIEVAKFALGNSDDVADMNASGDFLNKIVNNAEVSRAKNVDSYMVIGTCSFKPKLFMNGLKRIADKLEKVHDGLVGLNSSSYDLSIFYRSYKNVKLELNHDYTKDDPQVFTAIDQWMIKDKWFKTEIKPLQIGKYTGGLPVVVGKSRQEIVKIFGNNCLRKQPSGFLEYSPNASNIQGTTEWFYVESLVKDCCFTVYFTTYGADLGSTDSIKKYITDRAEAINYSNIYKNRYGHILPCCPQEVVPKEILEQKPEEICWENYGDFGVVVVWRYCGNTFVLGVKDTRRNLVDVIRPEDDANFKVRKNKNTDDFRNADKVFFFIQISGIVNLFNEKETWDNPSACLCNDEVKFEDCGKVVEISRCFYRFTK